MPTAPDRADHESPRTSSSAPTATPGGAEPLLRAGMVGGVLFLVSSVLQGALREGFSFSDHPPSALAGGDLGWAQVATFVVSGLLVAAGGAGLRLALDGPGAVWGPRLITIFGASLAAGGLFPMDPAFGYPPGAPPGAPDPVSWHGIVHGVVFMLGFGSLVIACVVFARRYRREEASGRRWTSLACGAAMLVLASSPNVGDPDGRFLLLWLAVAVSMGWTTAVITDVGRRLSVPATPSAHYNPGARSQ